MVDNNNFETVNDNLSEENIAEKPYYENNSNNFNNNNQLQNQNIASAPIINPQSEWQTLNPPIETEQINNNEQINPQKVMKKRRDKKNIIVVVLSFLLIGITIGSEFAQIKLKLFSILIFVDDLLVFAMAVLTLCCLFINKNIYLCVLLIPSVLITFGGAAIRMVGMFKFLKFGSTFMPIQFVLLAVRSFTLFFIPFTICSEYGRKS